VTPPPDRPVALRSLRYFFFKATTCRVFVFIVAYIHGPPSVGSGTQLTKGLVHPRSPGSSKQHCGRIGSSKGTVKGTRKNNWYSSRGSCTPQGACCLNSRSPQPAAVGSIINRSSRRGGSSTYVRGRITIAQNQNAPKGGWEGYTGCSAAHGLTLRTWSLPGKLPPESGWM
jgi:hypothetical protein